MTDTELIEFLDGFISFFGSGDIERNKINTITIHENDIANLTEIKERLEQQALPDEELVEKIIKTVIEHTAVDYSGKKLTTVYGLKCRANIRTLLQSRQLEKPRISREEIMDCVSFWQIDHAGNIIELLKSKGVEVVEKP